MSICYIFGSALGEPDSFTPKNNDLVIAADAGYLKLKKLGITPDLAVGDFDSLGEIPTDTEVVKHPVKKDDTDTLLAIKIGLEKGFKEFHFYGCTGNRLDHTLGALQNLSFLAERGCRGYLFGEDFIATAIKDDSLEFGEERKGNISVFAATSECEVSIDGLLYTTENEKITYDFPIGVSNEFIGKKAKITAHKGTAIIMVMISRNNNVSTQNL